MIRLELTLSEAEQLQQWLSTMMVPPTTQVDNNQGQVILDKLVAACGKARLLQVCPVFQRPFTQELSGRTGQYCSNACKQKAYRQRRDSWQQHYGPNDQP